MTASGSTISKSGSRASVESWLDAAISNAQVLLYQFVIDGQLVPRSGEYDPAVLDHYEHGRKCESELEILLDQQDGDVERRTHLFERHP
jgi:hypothetical protein